MLNPFFNFTETGQYNTPGTLFYPTQATHTIIPGYPEGLPKQLKPELNNKPPTTKPYRIIDTVPVAERAYHFDMENNKDMRGFHNPENIFYPHMQPGRVIVQNQNTNMQPIPGHQIQQPRAPRVIPRYSEYKNM